MTLDEFREATKEMPGDAVIAAYCFDEAFLSGKYLPVESIEYNKTKNTIELQ